MQSDPPILPAVGPQVPEPVISSQHNTSGAAYQSTRDTVNCGIGTPYLSTTNRSRIFRDSSLPARLAVIWAR